MKFESFSSPTPAPEQEAGTEGRQERERDRSPRGEFRRYLTAALAAAALAYGGAAKAETRHEEPAPSALRTDDPSHFKIDLHAAIQKFADEDLANSMSLERHLDDAIKAASTPAEKEALAQEAVAQLTFWHQIGNPRPKPGERLNAEDASGSPSLSFDLDSAAFQSLIVPHETLASKEGLVLKGDMAYGTLNRRFDVLTAKADSGQAVDVDMALTPEDYRGMHVDPLIDQLPTLRAMEKPGDIVDSDFRVTESMHRVLNGDFRGAKELLDGHRGDRYLTIMSLGASLDVHYDKDREAHPIGSLGHVIGTKDLGDNLKRAEELQLPITAAVNYFNSVQGDIAHAKDIEAAFADGSWQDKGYADYDQKWAKKFLATYQDDVKSELDALAKAGGMSEKDLLGGKSIEDFMNGFNGDAFAKQFEIDKGVCRDHAVYLAFVSSQLGIKDTFAVTTNNKGTMHVRNGGRDKDGSFFFQNYSSLNFTGLPSFRDALEASDAQEMQAPVLRHYVSRGEDQGKNVVPVTTRSGEHLRRIARGDTGSLSEDTREATGPDEEGETKGGLKFTMEAAETSVSVDKKMLGGTTMLRFTYLDGSEEQIDMIKKAYAVRAGQSFDLGTHGGLADVTLPYGVSFMTGELKTKMEDGQAVPLHELMLQTNPSLTGRTDLSDHLKYAYALGFETIVAVNTTDAAGTTLGSLESDLAADQRLSYIGSDFEAYVGVHADEALVPGDIRAMTPTALYSDLLAAEGGLKFKGHRLTIDADALFGVKGTSRDADVAKAALRVQVDNQYFLNLEGKLVDPHTFIVNPERKASAELGMQKGPLAVSVYGYYEKESLDTKNNEPISGVGLRLRIIVP